MHIPIEEAINLLHAASHGVLATHSLEVPGYPFATVLPYVPDAGHCPLFLISTLAEHTKNVRADGRAALLVADAAPDDVLAGARATWVGDVDAVEPAPERIARYLRYQPEGERYLALGDFALYRLVPQRIRLVAGFGRMGWITAEAIGRAAMVSAQEEAQVLARVSDRLHGAVRVLGLDGYGVDVVRDGRRQRLAFPAAAAGVEGLASAVAAVLAQGAA